MTQFRIADLMLATTLAAVYAAGASLTAPHTDGVGRMAFYAPLAIMPAAVIGLSFAARRQLGRATVTWRGRYWWGPHAAFVTLFVVGVAWSRWSGVSISILVPMCAAHHVLFFAMTPRALGEAGLLLGATLLRHADYELTLDENERRLRWRKRARRHVGWLHPTTGEIEVPEAKIAALRDAMAALPNDFEAGDA